MTDNKSQKPASDGGKSKPKVSAKEGCLSILVVGLVIGIAVALFSDPKAIHDASNELEVRYINDQVYDFVTCDKEEIAGYWFVRCYPSAENIDGGLYFIRTKKGDSKFYQVFALNSEAKYHVKRFDWLILDYDEAHKHDEDYDGGFNIPLILEEFK